MIKVTLDVTILDNCLEMDNHLNLLNIKLANLFLFVFVWLAITFFAGCGGSSDSSGSNSENDPLWSSVTPLYSGVTEFYEITPDNASKVAYEVVELLDLLNTLAFGDQFKHFLMLTENQSSNNSGDIICESGSVTIKEFVAAQRTEVIYRHCIFEGINIDGTVRFKTGSYNSVTGLLDVSFTDVLTGDRETYTGYFDVIQDSATYHVLVSSSNGVNIWFDNFKLSASLYSNEYGIFYSGDIYISNMGRLTISTSDLGQTLSNQEYYSSTISILGTDEIIMQVQVNSAISFQLTNEFLPVIIPLTFFPASLFDAVNNAPEAIITIEKETVDRSMELKVSGTSSNDPDYDLLSFEWEVVSKPELSQADIQQLPEMVFIGDIPGNYYLRLTVTDTQGNSSSSDKKITVLKNKPEGNIEFSQLEYSIGNGFIANVFLENDQFDEPFTYKLKYGPANMSVDENGVVNWDAVIPNFGKNVEVNFAVYVENEHKSNVINEIITLNSNSKPNINKRTNSQYVNWGESFVVKTIEDEEIYFRGIKLDKLILDNDIIKVNKAFLIGPSKDGNVYFQAVSDVNEDGINDYWYSFISNEDSSYSVLWVDGDTGEENEFNNFGVLSNSNIIIQVVDYDRDGREELLISNTATQSMLINMDTKEVITTFDINNNLERAIQFCDFNNDGYLDFVYRSDVYDVKNNQTIYEGNSFNVVDLSGNRHCEVVDVNDEGELKLINLEFGVEKIIFDNYFTANGTSVTVGDFDDDVSQEIMVSGYVRKNNTSTVYEMFILNNLSDQTVSLTPILFEDDNRILDLSAASIIVDLNNDGIDELVYTESTLDQQGAEIRIDEYKHVAYSLEGDTFQQQYSSAWYNRELHSIVDWDDNDTLTFLIESYSVYFVGVSEPGLEVKYDTEIRVSEIAIQKEDENFYVYKSDHPNTSLTKQDLFGNEIWVSDLQQDSNFNIQNIAPLNDKFLLVEGYNEHHLLSTVSGEILTTMPVTRLFSATQFVFHSTNEFDYLADISTKTILKLENDLTITSLSDEMFDNALNDSWHYTFYQYDDDAQPEIITYSTFNRSYVALDPLELTIENYSAFHTGNVVNGNNISSNLLQCFSWDKGCKNFVSNSNNRDSFEVVDKLTGNIIWQSPKLGGIIQDIQFKRIDNKVSATASFYDGYVYSVEN